MERMSQDYRDGHQAGIEYAIQLARSKLWTISRSGPINDIVINLVLSRIEQETWRQQSDRQPVTDHLSHPEFTPIADRNKQEQVAYGSSSYNGSECEGEECIPGNTRGTCLTCGATATVSEFVEYDKLLGSERVAPVENQVAPEPETPVRTAPAPVVPAQGSPVVDHSGNSASEHAEAPGSAWPPKLSATSFLKTGQSYTAEYGSSGFNPIKSPGDYHSPGQAAFPPLPSTSGPFTSFNGPAPLQKLRFNTSSFETPLQPTPGDNPTGPTLTNSLTVGGTAVHRYRIKGLTPRWRDAAITHGLTAHSVKFAYLMGFIEVGGLRAVTQVREPPCITCVKKGRAEYCLVPVKGVDPIMKSDRCSYCHALGTSCRDE